MAAASKNRRLLFLWELASVLKRLLRIRSKSYETAY